MIIKFWTIKSNRFIDLALTVPIMIKNVHFLIHPIFVFILLHVRVKAFLMSTLGLLI